MQENDWDSFVETLVSDNTTDGHAQNVQSPLSVVCDMPPAYYWQPIIALPPIAPMSQKTFSLSTTTSHSRTTHHSRHLLLHLRRALPMLSPRHLLPRSLPRRRHHYTVTVWLLSKKKPELRLRQERRERPSVATKRNWIVLGESSSSVATAQNAALSTKVTMYVQERLPMSSNELSIMNSLVCLPRWRLNDNRPSAQPARFLHWPFGPQSPVR